MYPLVNKEFLIRGVFDLPVLVNKRQNQVISLQNKEIADILLSCDGSQSVNELALRFDLDEADLIDFLQQFEMINALSMLLSPQKISVGCFLGPKLPWLREVHLDITDQCNLASYCKHCFRGEKLNQGNNPDIADWLKLLNQLSEIGVYQISLSGGEPFLKTDLPQIVDNIILKGMLLSAIFTNGTIFSHVVEDVIELITANEIQTNFYISLDGPDSDCHDLNRGLGSFDKVIKFIQKLIADRKSRRAVFKVIINSQINCYNYSRLIEWFDLLNNLGVDRWRFTSGRITGRLANNYFLLPDWDKLFFAYQNLLKFYLSQYQEGQSLMEINMESFFTTQMLADKKALIFDENLPICDYKQNACSIEPSGYLQFCTSWDSVSWGNVFRQDIKDIWYSEQFQKLKKMKIGEITECRGCELLKFCGGGCRLVTENIYDKDHFSCLKYQKFVEYLLPLLEQNGVIFSVDD